MSSEAVSPAVSPLMAELFDSSTPRGAWSVLGWAIAVGAHVLAAALAITEHRAPAPPSPPLEVELLEDEPPPPVLVAVPPPPAERPLERTPVAKAAAAPAPEPAHVGALSTAKEDPAPSAKAEEPVDFTNDPGALGFGSGVVAIGGKAEHGVANALRNNVAPASGTGGVAAHDGDALTPASDLSQKPSLGESDPCRGYFPSGAADDVANAAVMVTIGRTGAVFGVQLLSESPPKQGFGAAARTCMTSKRFSPGLDRNGKPTATAIRVNIRFMR